MAARTTTIETATETIEALFTRTPMEPITVTVTETTKTGTHPAALRRRPHSPTTTATATTSAPWPHRNMFLTALKRPSPSTRTGMPSQLRCRLSHHHHLQFDRVASAPPKRQATPPNGTNRHRRHPSLPTPTVAIDPPLLPPSATTTGTLKTGTLIRQPPQHPQHHRLPKQRRTEITALTAQHAHPSTRLRLLLLRPTRTVLTARPARLNIPATTALPATTKTGTRGHLRLCRTLPTNDRTTQLARPSTLHLLLNRPLPTIATTPTITKATRMVTPTITTIATKRARP